jgi:flavin-dependent dehydrogenase
LPLPGGAALSRQALDAALVNAAIAAGANFLPQTYATADSVDHDGRFVSLRQETRALTTRTRLLIAADGLGGRLLTGERGFRSVPADGSRIGAGTVAADGPSFYQPGSIFMACGAGGYVGLVRLEDGRLDIAAAFDELALREARGPAGAAARILGDVGWPTPRLSALAWRGTARLTRRPLRLAGDRVFVVGDAAGYVEPFTGEGIAWALSSAVALAPLAERAARHWQPSLPSHWRRLYQKTVGRRQRTCWAVAQVLRHPRLTSGVIRLLHHWPRLADPLIRRLNCNPSGEREASRLPTNPTKKAGRT